MVAFSLCAISLCAFSPCAGRVHAQTTKPAPLDEPGKIRALIESVRTLDEKVVFLRNGSEYTPREAADHMSLKWKNAGKDVKTAKDFITLCATKSSVSGKPYAIRFPDGKEVPSATYLTEQLEKLEK
jgi:sulfur carrier protein ThiS